MKKPIAKLNNLTIDDIERANYEGFSLEGINLQRYDLTGVDLRGADLRGADLSEADLRGATLLDACLYEANLTGANLPWANLRGADLRGADLRGANLSGADLRDVLLKNVTGNGREIISFTLFYNVVVTKKHVWVGCRMFTQAEFFKLKREDFESSIRASLYDKYHSLLCELIKQINDDNFKNEGD